VAASLGGLNGSSVALDTGFLGVNLRADSAFSDASTSALNSTAVRMVRFPGGGLADRFDPLGQGDRGTIYNDSGATEVAGTSLDEFVRWCQSTACESILTLPAEIDNTSEVRAIVSYTETQLGFRPTYWEVGNEPARWEHFGIPWADWNISQTSTPTPAQFAAVVNGYVQAIRTIDPTTGIIGLGGLGRASSGQSAWISSVVGENGPNLSAIAIHVYPAGSGFPSADLAGWFGSLGE
jgi:alpha-L-arabinofuranosidase